MSSFPDHESCPTASVLQRYAPLTMADKNSFSHFSVELQSPAPSDLGCTSHDDYDMIRMGKKQELKVDRRRC